MDFNPHFSIVFILRIPFQGHRHSWCLTILRCVSINIDCLYYKRQTFIWTVVVLDIEVLKKGIDSLVRRQFFLMIFNQKSFKHSEEHYLIRATINTFILLIIGIDLNTILRHEEVHFEVIPLSLLDVLDLGESMSCIQLNIL
jgi:hypothetical protein